MGLQRWIANVVLIACYASAEDDYYSNKGETCNVKTKEGCSKGDLNFISKKSGQEAGRWQEQADQWYGKGTGYVQRKTDILKQLLEQKGGQFKSPDDCNPFSPDTSHCTVPQREFIKQHKDKSITQWQEHLDRVINTREKEKVEQRRLMNPDRSIDTVKLLQTMIKVGTEMEKMEAEKAKKKQQIDIKFFEQAMKAGPAGLAKLGVKGGKGRDQAPPVDQEVERGGKAKAKGGKGRENDDRLHAGGDPLEEDARGGKGRNHDEL